MAKVHQRVIDESAVDVAYLLSRIDDLEREIKKKNLKLKDEIQLLRTKLELIIK